MFASPSATHAGGSPTPPTPAPQAPRRFALFANLRNINDATEDFEIAGPSTPAHAQFRQRTDFGALWTFGLKGRF